MKKVLLFGILLLMATFSAAQTKLAYGTIKEVSEARIVIVIVTEKVTQSVIVSDKAKAWREKAAARPVEFQPGERVRVRTKTDSKGIVLREIMDEPSEKWLDRIRHQYIRGEITERAEKLITFRLDDGSLHSYRVTPTTRIEIAGKATTIEKLGDGQAMWVKGRGLSSLDTQLLHATDLEPKDSPDSKTTSKPKPPTSKSRLPAANEVEGTVDLIVREMGILDLKVDGKLMHFRWTPRTQFTVGGAKGSAIDLTIGNPALIHFYRDQFGRLIASRVTIR